MQTIKTKFVLSLFSWVLITASLLGDPVRWTGGAQDVAQVDTIEFTGDWSTTSVETFTITCNGKAVVVSTGPTMITTADVAAGVAEAINANSTDGLTNDMTITAGGQQYAEFRDFEATVSGSVVTLTSVVPGVPFTVSTAETSAGGITFTQEATAATGKNHLDNAGNWEGGSVPGADDTLVFDTGNDDCLYGLDYFLTNTLEVSITRTTDYGGNIGLPEYNANGYYEYRLRQLQAYNATADKDILFKAGVNTNTTGTTRLDLDGQTYDNVVVDHMGRTGGGQVLEISGGTYDLTLIRGNVSIDPDNALPSAAAVLGVIKIGAGGLADAETSLRIGAGTHHSGTAGTLDQYSGRVDSHAPLYTTAGAYRNSDIYGGTFWQHADGDLGPVDAHPGGTFVWMGAGEAHFGFDIFSRGTVDMSQTNKAQEIDSTPLIEIYALGTLKRKPQVMADILPVGCEIQDINLE